MAIKKIACAVFAAAAVIMCQGGLSASASGGASSDDLSNNGAAETQDQDQDQDDDSAYAFSFEDDFPDSIGGYEVLSEFLPDGVGLEWNGKKLKAPKAGKVKYSKKDEGFVDKKDSDNPSGLTVKYNKKKGTVSGSFKVYVAKTEKKLKTYTAKYSGKLGESMKVYVKGKLVTTAIIE